MQPEVARNSSYNDRESDSSEDDHNDSKLFNLLSLSKREDTLISGSIHEEKYMHLMKGVSSDCEDTPPSSNLQHNYDV